jgi:predicted DNA-binding transcriptional regulator YafY
MPKVIRRLCARPTMERMMRIHQILQREQYPNCTSLGKDLEVVPRTVIRDLEFMRDRLRLPIAYNSRRRGYHYTEPVTQFPSLPISESEVFGLLVAHKAITQYHGTPFAHILETAFKKLTGQLDAEARFSLGSLDAAFSFRPFAPEDADLKAFEILTTGVRERCAVRFVYRKLGAKRAKQRHVHPYHLACIENHWYLFAFDVERQDMRTFVLARLAKPELLDEQFVPTERFDLNDYLQGSFGVFKGVEDHEVLIDFDAWAADLIRGRRWHHSQELIELPRRKVRLRLRLNSLEEAERWVLSWGTHATVVQPKRLATRIREVAAELVQRYSAAA